MNYVQYVAAAYAVFVIVLAWDFIIPRLQLRQELREARRRLDRASKHTGTSAKDVELTR